MSKLEKRILSVSIIIFFIIAGTRIYRRVESVNHKIENYVQWKEVINIQNFNNVTVDYSYTEYIPYWNHVQDDVKITYKTNDIGAYIKMYHHSTDEKTFSEKTDSYSAFYIYSDKYYVKYDYDCTHLTTYFRYKGGSYLCFFDNNLRQMCDKLCAPSLYDKLVFDEKEMCYVYDFSNYLYKIYIDEGKLIKAELNVRDPYYDSKTKESYWKPVYQTVYTFSDYGITGFKYPHIHNVNTYLFKQSYCY